MKLYNGDCLEIMKDIPDKSIDCIITSPPYDNLRTYNGTCNWNFEIFQNIAKEVIRVLKQGGVIVWVVSDATIKGSETGTSFRQALYFKELGLNLHDTMLYAKKNPMPQTHNRYEQAFEYMFCFSKGKPKTFKPIMEECKCKGQFRNRNILEKDKKQVCRSREEKTEIKEYKYHTNIFYYNVGGNKYNHPAIFPLQLAIDQIKTWTNENDIVLDCFMGSGSTGVACINTNRDFIGIELDKNYFEIASKRIAEAEKGKEGSLF